MVAGREDQLHGVRGDDEERGPGGGQPQEAARCRAIIDERTSGGGPHIHGSIMKKRIGNEERNEVNLVRSQIARIGLVLVLFNQLYCITELFVFVSRWYALVWIFFHFDSFLIIF
jgi:hypothetical protein